MKTLLVVFTMLISMVGFGQNYIPSYNVSRVHNNVMPRFDNTPPSRDYKIVFDSIPSDSYKPKKETIFNVNKGDMNIMTFSFSYTQFTEKPSYLGGSIWNITFLYIEENTIANDDWNVGGDWCIHPIIKSEVLDEKFNQESNVGGVLMYKLTMLPFIDIDLGGGILQETIFNQKTIYSSTEHARNYHFAVEEISKKWKPTLSCMIGLDVISLFKKGNKAGFVLQPNVLLSTGIKPVFGFNFGLKMKNNCDIFW